MAFLIALTQLCHGAAVVPSEMFEANRWAAAKFEGLSETAQEGARLEVLANYGPVQPDARGGQPLRLGDRSYSRGLYCHAASRIVVHLPQPGKTFSAVVGVDSNDQTSGGRGSVMFSVRVGEAEAWNSGVVREGMAGAPVTVDLAGAREFVLEVGDGGDGFSCDQADWADAKATLEDGAELWLSDLPMDEQRRAYTGEPFFSFTYSERPSNEFLSGWPLSRAVRTLDAHRTERTLTYTDPETGLEVRCVAVQYDDFPTVEWTLYFKNTGAADTPILSNIQAIDTRFERDVVGEFVLHGIAGDDCTENSYAPYADVLGTNAEKRFANVGGRPTNGAFPYYNIEWFDGGVLFALSWAGQWNTRFVRDDAAGLRILGGQELTHFTLHPGEEVRGPMVVLQFYRGAWLDAQNAWRRWMFAHNVPRPGGKPLEPMMSLCTGNYYPALMTEAVQERAFLERHMAENIDFDCWWQDAGWYPCDVVGWPKTGTWEVDPVRFPKGLRELSDLMHDHGKKTMVWFEPERVYTGTWITENHPEWVFGGKDGGLLKLGDPACRTWLTGHIDALLTAQGIDYYRQDFNIDPLAYWRANDAADRQGITEIRHVEGYFAYWDELRRRHPDMLIDSCASGGRRNDLETLRRAVPLLRSDYYNSPEGQQGLTYGLSFWIPYHGTGVIYEKDEYWTRSSMAAELSFGPAGEGVDHFDFERWRRLTGEWRRIAPYFLGDYYPLTPYSLDQGYWMAWQFHRPDLDAGVVQVYRRPESVYVAASFRLHGLELDTRYTLTNLDEPGAVEMTGRDLAEKGLAITLPGLPDSAIIVYSRAAGGN